MLKRKKSVDDVLYLIPEMIKNSIYFPEKKLFYNGYIYPNSISPIALGITSFINELKYLKNYNKNFTIFNKNLV